MEATGSSERQDDASQGLTIFEQILGADLPDEETFVLWRGDGVFAILNIHPYTSGHVLVLPYEPRQTLDELTEQESTELWRGVQLAARAIDQAYQPHGMNIGMNIGKAGGAGIPDHLHAHIVPRWTGDTNFMTALADTRVIPEPLELTWQKLRATWPTTNPPLFESGPPAPLS